MISFREILKEAVLVPDLSLIKQKLKKLKDSNPEVLSDEDAVNTLNNALPYNVSFILDPYSEDGEFHILQAKSKSDSSFEFEVSSGFQEVFEDDNWDRFVSYFLELMEHEKVHSLHDQELMTANPNNWEDIRDSTITEPPDEENLDDYIGFKKYYKNPGEMMANARQAYVQMRNRGLSNEDIKNVLRKASTWSTEDMREMKRSGRELSDSGSRMLEIYQFLLAAKKDLKAFHKFLKYVWEYAS
jgi:hypothetical protein